ncbi:MAG TPA: hypothetical protein DGT23_31935 [Micromonosporaceae bacterium]|nr:hypothetical protein [Micromonosporaceae bacterium]
MSVLSRFATAAVVRDNERLRHDIAVWRDRALSAERHRDLAYTQISNQRRVITEQAEAINELREENTVAVAKTRHDQLTIRDLRADQSRELKKARNHLAVCPTMQAIEDHDADKGRENAS